jgi:flagellar hook-associated protein 1 FlgK
MSLSSITGSATSGLLTAQTQLRVVSDNIANVNTPGYSRKVVDQQSVSPSSIGGGVTVGRIHRAVDQFLAQAGFSSAAKAGSAGVIADMLDRAQGLFGDPTLGDGYFNVLDQVFAGFSTAAQDSASSVTRNQVLTQLTNFFDTSSSIALQLQKLSIEADSRIADNLSQTNGLLDQIDKLNLTIVRDAASGGDTSGAENAQSQLIDKLSSMLDVAVTRRADGGIDIQSSDGSLLIGRAGAATLSYSTGGSAPGQIMVASSNGTPHPMLPNSGVLNGLLELRNHELPSIASQLGEYVTRAADEINRAHNASTAVPPPGILTGRNTGLDIGTAISGFTGKTTVAVVSSAGVVQSRIDIDFDAMTLSVDGAPASGFSAATFDTDLNAALGANGAASFSNGVLSISASSGNGVSIADDPTTPSAKAGRGFSHFFGLNDLVSSTGLPYPATGLIGTDPNGFTPGGQLTLRLLDANRAALRDVTITMPGGDMNALVTALNDPASGVGLYGSFSLSSTGELTFTASIPGVTTAVVADGTERGVGGPTLSSLFGISPTLRSQRAAAFSVRSDIAADSTKLAMAQLDLSAVAGQTAMTKGDARGGLLLAAADQVITRFDPAGAVGALSTTLADYASQFSGAVAQHAAAATASKANAEAVAKEADGRRASIEGVNLDEELIKLTTYQQAYNAAARLLQAVGQLYDTLLHMG